MLAHPWVKLQMIIENNMLHFSVTNSRPPGSRITVEEGKYRVEEREEKTGTALSRYT